MKREEGGGQIIIQTMTQSQQTIQQQSIEQRQIDHDEKKMRRQIANSNERRRMQSINAGFQSLRLLLPHHEGEKLSKVSGVSAFKRFSLQEFFYQPFLVNFPKKSTLLSVIFVRRLVSTELLLPFIFNAHSVFKLIVFEMRNLYFVPRKLGSIRNPYKFIEMTGK